MTEFKMTHEYLYDGVAALLLIKAKDGRAAEVAQQVAEFNEEEHLQGGYTVKGVRWTASVAPKSDAKIPVDVVANVEVPTDEALNELVERIHQLDGVDNPTPLILDHYHVTRRGHNSLPY